MSASICGQRFARNVQSIQVAVVGTTHVSGLQRPNLGHGSNNSRVAIEAEPWRWIVDRLSPVDHCSESVGECYIFDYPPEDLMSHKLPTSSPYDTTDTQKLLHLSLTFRHHEDQHPVDDRLWPVCHRI